MAPISRPSSRLSIMARKRAMTAAAEATAKRARIVFERAQRHAGCVNGIPVTDRLRGTHVRIVLDGYFESPPVLANLLLRTGLDLRDDREPVAGRRSRKRWTVPSTFDREVAFRRNGHRARIRHSGR